MEVNKLLDAVASYKSLRVIGNLGKGPYGDLYLVEDRTSGRKYGLRLISPEVSTRMPLGGLVDSVRDASEISHPNVATTYEFGFTGGQAYIVREYVSGCPVEAFAPGPSIPFSEIINIATQSARALVAVHEKGLVHNNIKPNNLIFTPDRTVKLVDLGLGPYTGRHESDQQRIIDEGMTGFRAPEVRRRETGSSRADLYSLGAVIHKLALGKPPSVTGLGKSTVPAVVENVRRLSELVRELQLGERDAARFGKVLDNLLDPEPLNRPTASELVVELNQIGETFESPARSQVAIKGGTISYEKIPAGRDVNAWLVDCELPLVVGKQHTLAVDIAERRSDRVGGGSFNEPDWGDSDQLELVILVDGSGVEVTPSFQNVVLPRMGNMESAFFGIRPKTKGPVRLNLSIFLARELTLLEEFLVELSAIEELEEIAEVAV